MATVLERPRAERVRHDATISIRVPLQTRDLIDSAAATIGKTRSEFMIESARVHAVDVLLDQRIFNLDEKQTELFLSIMDNPPEPTAKLVDLLQSPTPWQ